MVTRSRQDDIETLLIQITHECVIKVSSCMRIFSSMLTQLTSIGAFDAAEKNFQEILRIDEECKILKRNAEQQLMTYGVLLVQRGEYIRVLALLDKMLDKIEGAAYRALTLYKLNGFEDPAACGLSEITEKVYEGLEILKECLRALMLNVTALHEKLDEVELNEKMVDGLYRSVDVEILQSKLKVPHMILAREIASILEDIADSAEEISNIIRAIYPRGRY